MRSLTPRSMLVVMWLVCGSACRSPEPHAAPDPTPAELRARAERGRELFAAGDLAGARALRERQLADLLRFLPEDHPDLQAARIDLAESLHALGDLQGAKDLAERAVAALEATVPANDPLLARGRDVLAQVLATLGWSAKPAAAR